MTVQLPNQCPVQASYTPPSYPIGTFRSLSGAKYRVLFGNKPSDARLRLQYLLSNAEGDQWMRRYETTRGDFEEVLLAPLQWAGAENIGDNVPDHIRWHFDGPPELERVTKDRVRISVNLIGDLEAI